jgi:hypothetical protein
MLKHAEKDCVGFAIMGTAHHTFTAEAEPLA